MIDAAILLLIGIAIGLVFERVWSDICELIDIYREENR